jgi:hypothetical protein
MKKVYNQPYKNREGKYVISGYYGKAPKNEFKYDEIGIRIGKGCDKCGAMIYITPDEAADLIRAISASLHHWLVNSEMTKKIIKAKSL